nr:hypothetical protein [Marinicella sp. W31]MDC2879853.1 hypothetical protein [Marinicella sp. W31]
MRQDQIALQPGRIGGIYLDGGKLSEAGIDAVNRRISGGNLGNTGSSLLDSASQAGASLTAILPR